MHYRAAQNLVLFNQHREHGLRCTWTGLKKMALHELLTVCTSAEDVDTFRYGFAYLCQGHHIYCSEDLACYFVQNACPKPPFEAVNSKKCHLLFELFKKHGLKTFTTVPSFGDVIHEIVNICAKGCNVNEITRSVLLKIATSYEIYDEAYDEFQAAIPYLTERRAVDVNALDEPDFSSVMEFLEDKLLHLCSVFSTPSTNVFLHTKLDARKIHLIWTSILQNLPSNLCSGSVDVMRSFVRNGFDVKNALFRVCFSNLFFGTRCFEESFNDLLEILEIFMDHGARLNPLPGSKEQPFLHGVLSVHSEFFDENETRPTLYGFFTKCIKRGVDPKLCSVDWLHDDLLFAVCYYYNADDKNDLIEYLCDCGAGASLYRNNGADLWLLLSCRSGNELAQPRSNEVLLTLLRRGLRTGCVDKDGNNVLHMYFCPYITNHKIEGCCMFVRFRALDELKFWDVVDALLGAGVPVGHVNNAGETPFDLFKCIIRSILQDDVEPCSQCFKRHFMERTSSVPGKLEAQLTRVGKYAERLSPLSFAN